MGLRASVSSVERDKPNVMSERGVVLGFYQNQNVARAVLRELRRFRFRCSASIYHHPDGRFLVDDYDVSRRAAVPLGAGAGLFVELWLRLFPLSPAALPAFIRSYPGLLLLMVAGAAIGWLLAWLLDFGVKDALIAHYKRWVVPNETLILVQAPTAGLGRVLEIMRQVEAEVPITFVFHPQHRFKAEPLETLLRPRPLTAERLSLEAGRLAATIHPVAPRSVRGRPLM